MLKLFAYSKKNYFMVNASGRTVRIEIIIMFCTAQWHFARAYWMVFLGIICLPCITPGRTPSQCEFIRSQYNDRFIFLFNMDLQIIPFTNQSHCRGPLLHYITGMLNWWSKYRFIGLFLNRGRLDVMVSTYEDGQTLFTWHLYFL